VTLIFVLQKCWSKVFKIKCFFLSFFCKFSEKEERGIEGHECMAFIIKSSNQSFSLNFLLAVVVFVVVFVVIEFVVVVVVVVVVAVAVAAALLFVLFFKANYF